MCTDPPQTPVDLPCEMVCSPIEKPSIDITEGTTKDEDQNKLIVSENMPLLQDATTKPVLNVVFIYFFLCLIFPYFVIYVFKSFCLESKHCVLFMKLRKYFYVKKDIDSSSPYETGCISKWVKRKIKPLLNKTVTRCYSLHKRKLSSS